MQHSQLTLRQATFAKRRVLVAQSTVKPYRRLATQCLHSTLSISGEIHKLHFRMNRSPGTEQPNTWYVITHSRLAALRIKVELCNPLIFL